MDMETWTGLGSSLASIMFIFTIMEKFFPFQLETYFSRYTQRLFRMAYPYVEITIPEYSGNRMKRSDAYSAIESYLSSSCSQHANRLKADFGNKSSCVVLSMDDHEEVTDDFHGINLWWSSGTSTSHAPSNPYFPAPDEERRYYKLIFHKSHRDMVVSKYMKHVMDEGKEIKNRNRKRKLFTNNKTVWSHVAFEHPSSFDTVAMEPGKKKEILDDLDAFKKGKEYYAKIGKAWRRGYLLYGPPGTGKSTMIAAMANYMDYDIYDLELTTVKTNSDLRRLLIETTSKSIILIEDIDCSLELTRKRKKKMKEEEEKWAGEEMGEKSHVTLSGLLNFIDGLWSAFAGERLIVFTTNYIEKLDPALIRRGRMDRHIEMAYCCFEAFKVLADNYLGIGSHRLFERIRGLMEEVRITPADVVENLMPKSVDENADTCLESLVLALSMAKEASLEDPGKEEIVETENGGTSIEEPN